MKIIYQFARCIFMPSRHQPSYRESERNAGTSRPAVAELPHRASRCPGASSDSPWSRQRFHRSPRRPCGPGPSCGRDGRTGASALVLFGPDLAGADVVETSGRILGSSPRSASRFLRGPTAVAAARSDRSYARRAGPRGIRNGPRRAPEPGRTAAPGDRPFGAIQGVSQPPGTRIL